jgi:hypothetical protein
MSKRNMGSGSRLSLVSCIRDTKWRAIIGCAAGLVCIGVIGGSYVGRISLPILVDSAFGAPAPPGDAVPLTPGLRVQRPSGWVEIRTFNRSQKSTDTVFEIEFLYINESSATVRLDLSYFVRLIADGIPRAPSSWKISSEKVLGNSAEYCNAKFTVRGRPRVVHVQFGSEDEGLSFLRWPN